MKSIIFLQHQRLQRIQSSLHQLITCVFLEMMRNYLGKLKETNPKPESRTFWWAFPYFIEDITTMQYYLLVVHVMAKRNCPYQQINQVRPFKWSYIIESSLSIGMLTCQ